MIKKIFILIYFLSTGIGATFAALGGNQENYRSLIELEKGYEITRIYKPVIVSPFDVVVSPGGEVFVTGIDNDLIYKLSLDGNVTEFIKGGRTTLALNSKGELFCDSAYRILKILPDGKIKNFVPRMGAFQLAVGPSGDLFIIESGLDVITRVNQKGKRTIFFKGLSNPGDLEFSPSGELYVTQMGKGEISKINKDGSITTVAKGFNKNDPIFIAFDSKGDLFAIDTMYLGLVSVSLENGTISKLPIFSPLLSMGAFGDFVFDSKGDIILLGTTKNVIWKISLRENKIYILYSSPGNSDGLAVDKSGDIFLGYDSCFPLAPGKIIKIKKDGTTSIFADGFGLINDLTFDNNGNLYVCSFSPGNDGRPSECSIFRKSAEGAATKIFTTNNNLSGMAINSLSGDLIVFDTVLDKLIKIRAGQETVILPFDFGEDVFRAKLTFDNNGNLFIFVVFSKNFGVGPLKRKLYKISSDNKISTMADFDTPSSSSTDDIALSPTGDLFVIASGAPAFVMFKITTDGKVTKFADHLPCDPLSLAVDQDGNIFFASSAGVFKIFKQR